jgi:hypothetical protein
MVKIAPLLGASSAVARGSQLALVGDAANMAWEVAWSSAMRARMSASYVMMIVCYGRERQWNYCTIMGNFVTSNALRLLTALSAGCAAAIRTLTPGAIIAAAGANFCQAQSWRIAATIDIVALSVYCGVGFAVNCTAVAVLMRLSTITRYRLVLIMKRSTRRPLRQTVIRSSQPSSGTNSTSFVRP